MGESLTPRRRVRDEGLRVVNLHQKVTANFVPAAAVIRRWQALSGLIGRKEICRRSYKLYVKYCGPTAVSRVIL